MNAKDCERAAELLHGSGIELNRLLGFFKLDPRIKSHFHELEECQNQRQEVWEIFKALMLEEYGDSFKRVGLTRVQLCFPKGVELLEKAISQVYPEEDVKIMLEILSADYSFVLYLRKSN